ncbi:MAG TPA: hypothetical protein PLL76_17995, partial [Thermoanaerobaculia bacterium]|nr:hypothetical protein [Thermoanaerobaculia bacterium]HQP88146.1 hypothetical protein [Thermoanaerobaculia bacterium]
MPAALLLAAVLSAVPPAPAPEALHAAWPGVRLSPPSGSYTPEALRADLESLAGAFRDVVRIAEKGRSSEGREIPVVLAGSGPEKVLLWSQMHG